MADSPSSPKQCIYCLEEVNSKAIRCKHCGADLIIAGERSDPDSRKVVYVVDRDLIRFGKLASAVLGLFAVLGIYLFGIDLKDFHSDIKKILTDVESQSKAIRAEQASIQQEQKAWHASYDQATELLDQVRNAHAEVQQSNQLAKGIVDALLKEKDKVLFIEEFLATGANNELVLKTRVATVSNTASAEADQLTRQWSNGTVLHYYFFDMKTDGEQLADSYGTVERRDWVGTDRDKDTVRRGFTIWKEVGIGLDFAEVATSEEAQIRIGFMDGDGSWAFDGTQCLETMPDERTVNFGWDISNDIDTVLHNIGHVMGLKHEHQNPFNGLEWDEEAVYSKMSQPPNNWPREVTYNNILRKYPRDAYPFEKPFDPDSIMMYPFQAGLIKGRYSRGIQPAPGLSEGDKAYVRKLYPPHTP